MAVPLIAAAHGTDSPAGQATVRALVDLVRAARPDLDVRLCFLDVLAPRLGSVVESWFGPAVVVPLLLSGGYHVHDDIPALAASRPGVVVARHLGPDPLVTRALLDRLDDVRPGGSVALVGSPSTRTSAARDLAAAAALLGAALGREVSAFVVDAALPSALARLDRPVTVASYLLAEGQFHDTLRAIAGVTVTPPIGAHPAIAELIGRRYDDVA